MKLENIKRVNKVISVRDVLEELGVEIDPSGLLFCPFHDDVHKKSAKLYEDSNKIWCFVEKRHYGSCDVMKKLGYSEENMLNLIGGSVGSIGEDYKGVKFPIVDSESKNDFKRDGDLVKYLDILDRYWKFRDKLKGSRY